MRAMAARRIHHLGVAVAELAPAVATYERMLGARVEQRERVDEQGVEAVALLVGDDSRVELLAPLGADSFVGRFIERRGPGVHHVAYGVDDLEAELERLRAAGANLIDETPRPGLYGPVAFIHHDTFHGVLTELVESEES
jgi:methylmalonyl-CoA/ethylmalonyl-CoA epimerase